LATAWHLFVNCESGPSAEEPRMILLDTDVMIDILGPQDNLRPFFCPALRKTQ